MKIKRNPESIHRPFSTYSHHIELDRESRMVAISGQVGVDSTGIIVEGIADQLAVAWQNVGENLSAANMSYDDIIKLTVYLVEGCIDQTARRGLFAEKFGSINPCMTVLYVAALGDPMMKVELDVWASAK